MTSRISYWVVLMTLLAAAYGGWKWYQVRQFETNGQGSSAVSRPNLPVLEDFELPLSNGETFRSSDMRGKVWATTFFFSTCPGTCSRLNANIKYMTTLKELNDVTWLSISVDPVTDTIPVLQEYAKQMNADPERWLFARGEMDYLKRIGQEMLKLPVSYKGHNDHAVVIGKSGKIRGHYNALSTRECERMRLKLLELLGEDEPDEGQGSDDQGRDDKRSADASSRDQPA